MNPDRAEKAIAAEPPSAAASPAPKAAPDDRRLALVRAAYDIIAAEGFERLRTRDVAERVGVNIATLHYYFATKEALIEAVAVYLSGQFQTSRAPLAAAPASDALARLRQEFADARFYLGERPEMIAVMQELNQRARRDPVIAGIIEPLKRHWQASIEEVVAAGLHEGVFAADLSPRDAAAAITAMFWGASTLPLDAAARDQIYAAIERWLITPSQPSERQITMKKPDDIFLGIDHITIPVKDLALAERFYVDILGGKVAMRIDAAFLQRFGRTPDPNAFHLSLTFGSDTHLALFQQDEGQPAAATGHPHVAIRVRPEALAELTQRLRDHNVPVEGPNRLGPPGQASVYFNDPFGNHLEFETMGYAGDVKIGPPNMQALAYSWAD